MKNMTGIYHYKIPKMKKPWQVKVYSQRKYLHVGYFKTLDKAILARDKFLRALSPFKLY